MDKRLMYIPKKFTFTDDSTGEVVSGGKIALTDIEPVNDSDGRGYFCELVWVTGEILDKLEKNVKELPCNVRLNLENRGLKSKPKLVDIDVL